MVRTIGLGRIPRVASSGLRVQVGTIAVSSTVGSFAVNINTVRHVEMAFAAPTAGTIALGSTCIPVAYGTSKSGYVAYQLMKIGTFGRPAAKYGTYGLSFVVVGE